MHCSCSDAFLETADRLIYYIFFPVLLFWKIGAAASDHIGDPGLYKATVCAVVGVYALSSLYIKLFKVPTYQAGSFSQACYRFNTYIGMAVVLNALGEDGARLFSILIGLIIPIINILAVSTLSWYLVLDPVDEIAALAFFKKDWRFFNHVEKLF